MILSHYALLRSNGISRSLQNTRYLCVMSTPARHQMRYFGTIRKTRIETKFGVGVRYRRPRVAAGVQTMLKGYESSDITRWRDMYNLGLAQEQRRSNFADLNTYSDEELLNWRSQFDAYSGGQEEMNLSQFSKLVKAKYEGHIEAKEIATKAVRVWTIFDKDSNNSIDFGEFIRAGFHFDMNRLRESVEKEGVKEVFEKYAVDGFIGENETFHLMGDYNFFQTSSSETRKFLKAVDYDADGMLNIRDFEAWAEQGTVKGFDD